MISRTPDIAQSLTLDIHEAVIVSNGETPDETSKKSRGGFCNLLHKNHNQRRNPMIVTCLSCAFC